MLCTTGTFTLYSTSLAAIGIVRDHLRRQHSRRVRGSRGIVGKKVGDDFGRRIDDLVEFEPGPGCALNVFAFHNDLAAASSSRATLGNLVQKTGSQSEKTSIATKQNSTMRRAMTK